MATAEYVETLVVGVFIGALIGPPLGHWSVFWEDRLDRHRARCDACRRRAVRRAERQAARHA
ncbi:hypothetical protein [Actinophytocola sediminis]